MQVLMVLANGFWIADWYCKQAVVSICAKLLLKLSGFNCGLMLLSVSAWLLR
ncbi:hypothetical protein ACV1DY_02495 [Aeromonas caviae]